MAAKTKEEKLEKYFNKHQDICEAIYQCCTHYKTSVYSLGYVLFKPFKIAYCENCGEVHLICNNFLSFLFEHVFSYFWDGCVKLSDVKFVLLQGEKINNITQGEIINEKI
jgi:hypothetical protein